MGSFSLDFPSDFQKIIEDQANMDRIAPKILDETLPIAEAAMKNALQDHNDTGDLLKSIQSKKKSNSNGHFGYVTAIGTAKGKTYNRKQRNRTKQEPYRNYQKLLALEYGTSKQNATPFLDKAISDCEDKVIEQAQKVIENEVDS